MINRLVLSSALLFIALVGDTRQAHSDIPEEITYQGYIADFDGTPLPGPVNLTFQIWDAESGGNLLWSESQANISLVYGVFDVLLGSVNPITIDFDEPRYLATLLGGSPLAPRVLMGASPYSLGTASLADGAGVRSLNGLKNDLKIVGGVNVSVSEAGDSITIAATGGGGGSDSDWQINGNDMASIPSGSVGVGTGSPSGKFHVYTEGIAGTAMFLEDGGTGSFGLSVLALKTQTQEARLQVVESTGGNRLQLDTLDPGMDIQVIADDEIELFAGNTRSVLLEPNGVTRFLDSGGATGVLVLPNSGQGGGGQLDVNNSAGSGVVRLESNADGGGLAEVLGSSGAPAIQLHGNNGSLANGGGELTVYSELGSPRIQLEGSEAGNSTDGGQISIYNDAGLVTAVLDGDLGDTNAGTLEMFAANGNKTVEIRAQESTTATNGASLKLFDDTGALTIELDGDYGSSGEGRIITETIEITGGADLSEQFVVELGDQEPEPGTVLVIDSARPGGLTMSDREYDSRVAGVISGAGGVKPGMLMGQSGTAADGEVPVALTGRVYVRVDASYGPIEPGSLLTTSPTPGYAMLAGDRDRSQGAILGKAMTGLAEGRGLVLVLIALQ